MMDLLNSSNVENTLFLPPSSSSLFCFVSAVDCTLLLYTDYKSFAKCIFVYEQNEY